MKKQEKEGFCQGDAVISSISTARGGKGGVISRYGASRAVCRRFRTIDGSSAFEALHAPASCFHTRSTALCNVVRWTPASLTMSSALDKVQKSTRLHTILRHGANTRVVHGPRLLRRSPATQTDIRTTNHESQQSQWLGKTIIHQHKMLKGQCCAVLSQ